MKTSFKIAIALVTLTCGTHQLFCMDSDDFLLLYGEPKVASETPTTPAITSTAASAPETPLEQEIQQGRFTRYGTAFRSTVSTGKSAASTAKHNFMSNFRGLKALGLTGIAGTAAHTAQDVAHAARDLAVQTREKVRAMDSEQRKALLQKAEVAGFVTAALACLYVSKNKPQQ